METKEKKNPSGYGTVKYSLLEEAFEKAAATAAQDIMYQQFTEGTAARAKLNKMVNDAIVKWLAEESERMVETITKELSRAVRWINFSKDRSY